MLDQKMEFGAGRSLNLMIPTDCLAEVRKKVRQGWHVHSLPLPNGKMMRVIRQHFDSYFPEDAGKPNYGCIDAAVAGKLLGACVGEKLVWWVAADPDKSSLSRDLVSNYGTRLAIGSKEQCRSSNEKRLIWSQKQSLLF